MFRREIIVFLYVSLATAVNRKENMAKKMTVHWVQCHDLRTVTKEPRTGLSKGVSFDRRAGEGGRTREQVRGRDLGCRYWMEWLYFQLY